MSNEAVPSPFLSILWLQHFFFFRLQTVMGGPEIKCHRFGAPKHNRIMGTSRNLGHLQPVKAFFFFFY